VSGEVAEAVDGVGEPVLLAGDAGDEAPAPDDAARFEPA